MPKLFYMQFVTKEWRAAVAGCSAAAIGCWIQLVACMWDEGQTGVLEGTMRELASKCGLQVDEFGEGLLELQRKGVGSVTPDLVVIDDRKTRVRVECRRMARESARRSQKAQWFKENEQEKDDKQTNNRHETVQEQSDTRARARFDFDSDSSGSASEGKSAEKGSDDGFDFEGLYASYPRKEGKKKGLQRCRSQITSLAKWEALKRAVNNYRARVERERTEPKFIKQFDTFMNCWEDYLTAPAEATSAVAPPPEYHDPDEERRKREAAPPPAGMLESLTRRLL